MSELEQILLNNATEKQDELAALRSRVEELEAALENNIAFMEEAATGSTELIWTRLSTAILQARDALHPQPTESERVP